jgi:hypothetical protein
VCMDLWFILESHMGCVEAANDMDWLPSMCALRIKVRFFGCAILLVAGNSVCLVVGNKYLNDTWFGEDQRSKSKQHKDTCFKEIKQHFQILLLTTLYSIVNKIGRTYVSN